MSSYYTIFDMDATRIGLAPRINITRNNSSITHDDDMSLRVDTMFVVYVVGGVVMLVSRGEGLSRGQHGNDS